MATVNEASNQSQSFSQGREREMLQDPIRTRTRARAVAVLFLITCIYEQEGERSSESHPVLPCMCVYTERGEASHSSTVPPLQLNENHLDFFFFGDINTKGGLKSHRRNSQQLNRQASHLNIKTPSVRLSVRDCSIPMLCFASQLTPPRSLPCLCAMA